MDRNDFLDSVVNVLVAATNKNEKIKNIKDFESFYTQLIGTYLSMMNETLSDQEAEYVKDKAYDEITFPNLETPTVMTQEVFNDKWLENREDISFDYSDRYFNYLKNDKNWTSYDRIKNDSFNTIQMLGDPNPGLRFDRKGLLIGDVQSGKTANFTAVLNRAVDVGYNIVIVLAGLTEVLRYQTQVRLDYDLIGTTADKPNENVGVGLKRKLSRVVYATTSKKDFSKSVSQTVSTLVSSDRTILFVTKKNVSTLKAIKDALEQSNVNHVTNDGRIRASLLIVDDEADNASVDTSSPDKNPSAINKAIRSLLHLFTRTSYLAVTATPFANIFIDDGAKEEFGEDLFPSDFISYIARSPLYTGAKELFGETELRCSEKLIGEKKTYSQFCINEVYAKEMASTYPYRHKKDVRVSSFEDLPLKMKKAIRYFILVQGLMDYLPKPPLHRTMMINVSRFVDVQNDLFQRIAEWLDEKLKPQVKKYANLPGSANNPNAGEYYQLKKVWDSESLETLSGMSWEEFSPHLSGDSISALRVVVVNNGALSKAGNSLDYNAHPEGDRVIAVGGQCLSRGLTLETLVVSFFYRNSAAYDTLLQMGRWFGYRSDYIRYFRIWMSDDSVRWYGMISDACDDLRVQIESMNNQSRTPSEFGLAVKYHPSTKLIITAKSKMKSAQVSAQKVVTDLRCRLLEGPRFYDDPAINLANKVATEELVNELDPSSMEKEGKGGYYWKNIPRDRIAKFLRTYRSKELNLGFSLNDLEPYVRNSTSPMWDIGIVHDIENKKTKAYILGNGVPIYPVPRPYEVLKDNVLNIYGRHARIGSADVAKLGLSNEEYDKLMENDFAKENKNIARTYLDSGLVDFERNCILFLYPIWLYHRPEDSSDKKIKIKEEDRVYYPNSDGKADFSAYVSEQKDGERDPWVVWGIGLGFAGKRPAENETSCFSYYLNPVFMRTQIGYELFDNEGEEDDIADE